LAFLFEYILKHFLVQEEKQRGLLHLQQKAMEENQQVDQKVNSKKVLGWFSWQNF
jgi:hypothetical protein